MLGSRTKTLIAYLDVSLEQSPTREIISQSVTHRPESGRYACAASIARIAFDPLTARLRSDTPQHSLRHYSPRGVSGRSEAT
jgi:hypothetical protein